MPRLTLTGTNIDAPDANALADFYRRLLGWTTRVEEPGWVIIQAADGGSERLSFQTESRYVRPVWPASSRRRTCGSASTPRDTPSACSCSDTRRCAVT
jgi:Glyoxalase-like domain